MLPGATASDAAGLKRQHLSQGAPAPDNASNGVYYMVVAFPFIFWTAWAAADCISSCERPTRGRGLSLLQAASRNKSRAAGNETLPDQPGAAAEANVSDLEDAIEFANSVANVAAETYAGPTDVVAKLNETGYATSEVNLTDSLPDSQEVNYSDVSEDEEVQIPLEPPYTSNESNVSVTEVHPIKGATPLPAPSEQLTDAMRDCIMGDWASWSACFTDEANGFAGPHQQRERSVLQPYMGGEKCKPASETRNCNLLSAVKQLVNLGE